MGSTSSIGKLFTNNWNIAFLLFLHIFSGSWLKYLFFCIRKNLPDKGNQIFTFYIFNIKTKKGMLWKIFGNRKNICKMKMWQAGIGTYFWPKYQRIDMWQIYFLNHSQIVCKLFAEKELYPKHRCSLYGLHKYFELLSVYSIMYNTFIFII